MSEPIIPNAHPDADVLSSKSPVFKVASVDKTDAPEGELGRDWYRYVLKSSRSTIIGHRCGSREYVHEYATQCAEQLNARASSCQSIWSPRGRKPAATSSN
jgi:hypothetical protein